MLDYLVASAHEERFEAGMESRFSRGLQQLYASDPSAVLYALRRRLDEDGTRPEVLSEVLDWSSRQETSALRQVILDLLAAGLSTAENTLSVYALDQPERQVERVVAALALTRVIEECGIARISLPGTTPDPEANLWHQDPPFVRAGGVGRQTEDVTKECGIGIAGDVLRLNGVTIRERGIRHS